MVTVTYAWGRGTLALLIITLFRNCKLQHSQKLLCYMPDNFALLIYQLISDFIYWHTFSPLGVIGLLFV